MSSDELRQEHVAQFGSLPISEKPSCDCLNVCGDDPRLEKGFVTPCPMYVKKHNTRSVVVSKEGVQFGNCWISHEKITGQTAAQLNAGGHGVVGQQYVKWLRGVV